MISNISWTSYWSVVIVCIILYYVYVLLVYYRGDIRSLLTGKRNLSPASSSQPTASIKQRKDHSENDNEILPAAVQSLSDEMTAYLDQASYAKAGKTEIIFALQQIAKKYDGINGSHYQPAINRLIVFESNQKCAVHLSEEEIGQVWLG